MTIAIWLRTALKQLADGGIGTARLDALVLLEDCTGYDRSYILAHPELELSNEQIRALDEQISRRLQHVPLAYIRGKTEFYGREFIVNDYVLEPRPESETMIELLKKFVRKADNGYTIVDVGTGSGALAVTAKLELPKAKAIAIDIDPNSLKIAHKNAKKLGANIDFREGDLLSPLIQKQPQKYALLCNLPYVPDTFHINQAATHEPRLAIFGGPDGLEPYRKLFMQIDSLRIRPEHILTESMPPQHEQLSEIAATHGYRQQTEDDFIQVFVP